MLADNGVTAAPVLADAPIELVAAPDVVPALLSEPVEVEILAASSKAHTTGLTDQTNYLPPRRVITVYLGLSIGLVCSILEQTVVATALPRIASDLHSGKESAWVATAYLCTSLAFTPLYGRFSDIWGRKILLVSSLGIFFVFSLACALARTMIQLIIFRALQGIGGGAIMTLVFIILADIVPLRDRGKYQGIGEGVIIIADALGPLLGGVFSQDTTWRWVFWINLPLSGIAMVVGIWLVPSKSVEGRVKDKLLKADYVGSALTIVGSILVLIGLNWGGVVYSWSSAPVLATLLAGVAIMTAFVLWEAKVAALPIVSVGLFKYKTVVGICISSLMAGATILVVIYYIPQLLQLVRGSSPLASSLLLLPFLLPIAPAIVISGFLISRTGHYKYFIVAGFLLWTISQGLQTTLDQYSSDGKLIGILIVAGIGAGLTAQTQLLAIQAAVPRHEMAVATGMRAFVRLFGSTLGLAIAGALVNNALRTALAPLGLSAATQAAVLDDPTAIHGALGAQLSVGQRAAIVDGYTRGFRAVFDMTLACQAIGLASVVLLVGQHDLDRDNDDAHKHRGVSEKADVEAAEAKNTP